MEPALAAGNLPSIIHLQNKWDLQELYKEHPEYEAVIGSNGHERRLTSSIFTTIDAFSEVKTTDADAAILGVISNNRCIRYIPSRYIDSGHKNFIHYKTLVPAANGLAWSELPAQMIGTPLIGTPRTGYTQSFLGIGSFESREEAEACLKYIKSKFARTMLGVLKVTQHNSPEKWRYVPLQDFTASSDIDWTKPIPEIDRQLYAKYGLSADEIEFIETHIKEMA